MSSTTYSCKTMWVSVVVVVAVVTGCAEPVPGPEVAANAGSSTGSAADGAPTQPAAPATAAPSSAPSQPQSPPPNDPPPVDTPLAQGEVRIRFTAVAGAQTLPEGTMLGFSVKYQVTSGTPHQSFKYFLNIDGADGVTEKSIWLDELQQSGEVAVFIPGLPIAPSTYTVYFESVPPVGSQKTLVSAKVPVTYTP